MGGSDVAMYTCNSLATARSIANDKLQGKDSDYFAAWCSERKRIWIKTGAKTYTPHESWAVTLFTKPTKPTVDLCSTSASLRGKKLSLGQVVDCQGWAHTDSISSGGFNNIFNGRGRKSNQWKR